MEQQQFLINEMFKTLSKHLSYFLNFVFIWKMRWSHIQKNFACPKTLVTLSVDPNGTYGDYGCITYLFGFFFVCRGRKSKWEFHVHSGKTGLWMGVMVKKLCWENEQLNTKWLYILTPADPRHDWDPCVTYLGWIPLPSHCLASQC